MLDSGSWAVNRASSMADEAHVFIALPLSYAMWRYRIGYARGVTAMGLAPFALLPVKIFASLRYGYSPVMAAISVLFFAVAVALFALVGRVGDLPRLLGADERA